MKNGIVLFDLDGTLIDSAADIHAAANLVLEQEGLGLLTKAQVQSFVGNGLPVLITRLLGAHGLADDIDRHARMLSAFETAYTKAVGLTTVYPGVPQALDTLLAQGRRLGVVTNKPLKPALAVLAHLDLHRRFGLVLGGDSLPQRKPDAEPLLHAARLLGGGPAIYVGDSEVDAEAAANAALPLLLFTEGYRKKPVESLPHAAAFSDYAALSGLVDAQLLYKKFP